MSDNQMWFGNRNKMQWVPCPTVGAPVRREVAAQSMGFLNGGAWRRMSMSGAKVYELDWSLNSRDSLRPITDYAEGVFGPGPLYWSDPFTMDKNVAAQSFATPSVGGYDGVILTGTDVRPELIPTSANSLGYPHESALYDTTGMTDPIVQWVPVPPGYTAWVGVHGSPGAGGGVVLNFGAGDEEANLLGVDDLTRVVDSGDYPDGGWLSVRLGGVGTITLTGIMIQVLPTGIPPETGGFISGQGHSGCSFDGEHPEIEAYSAAMDLIGMSARLVETEQWQ